MIEELKNLQQSAEAELSSADPAQFQELKNKYLGRKGLFASISARMGALTADERRAAGQELNRVKKALEEIFSQKEKELSSRAAVLEQSFDTSMPGTFYEPGTLHPLTRVVLDITAIFKKLGFGLADGPEVDTERYNFEALNIPLNHPSRDGFDTFYLENGKLLRSQTSTVQIRVMEKTKPPVKIIAFGKVYRPDATDATHASMFHQVEGLMVDRGVSFADLKGVLLLFALEFFGSKTQIRFRPSFFPFTEPSAEMDIYSEKRGWLEILGAGMVHPNVLRSVKVGPEKYTGFAFGMGVERLAMMRYGVQDIRQFCENDIRFLRQF